MQYIFSNDIRDFVSRNGDYLNVPVGNLEDDDQRNQKVLHPRVWPPSEKQTVVARVKMAICGFQLWWQSMALLRVA